MKFLINEQEVEQEVFFNTFYATSLNAETDITLAFVRVFAETMMDKEKFEEMTKAAANFYTINMFNKQTSYVVAGNLFRIERDAAPEPENSVEVAAE